MNGFLESAAAASTVILVGVTTLYVFLTYRILKENQRTADLMQKQVEALTRPYIVVDAFANPGETVLRLRIRNLGGTTATNLQLALDRPLYRRGEKVPQHDFSSFSGFATPILSFVPKAEIVFNLDSTTKIFSGKFDEVLPSQFTITVSYTYGQKSKTEKHDIDLTMYRNAALNSDITVDQLKAINENLEKLTNTIREFRRG